MSQRLTPFGGRTTIAPVENRAEIFHAAKEVMECSNIDEVFEKIRSQDWIAVAAFSNDKKKSFLLIKI